MLFENFFNNDLVAYIAEQSILYAKYKGNHTFTVTIEEIRAFFTILLISGYASLTEEECIGKNSLMFPGNYAIHTFC